MPRLRDPIRKATIQSISGNRCAITFDSVTTVRGVPIVGDPALLSVGSQVLVQYVDNRPVIVSAGTSRGDNRGSAAETTVISGDSHDPLVLAASAEAILGLTGQQLYLDSQSGNTVLASPAHGGVGLPIFRSLVLDDLPAIGHDYLGNIQPNDHHEPVTAGAGIGVSGQEVSHVQIASGDLHPEYAQTAGAETITGGWQFGIDLLPTQTDTYDLGGPTALWRKGWLSELESLRFVEQTVVAIGGWLVIPHGQGTLGTALVDDDLHEDYATFNPGGALVEEGDFIVLRGNLQMEYLKVLTDNGDGTYTVERDVDGSGPSNWPVGQVFIVLGKLGDGRIEFDAQTGSPRLSVIVQGSTYNAQDEWVRLGTLEGWGPYPGGTPTFGFAVGDPNGDYLTWDPDNGLTIAGDGSGLTNIDGSAITTGAIDAQRIAVSDLSALAAQTGALTVSGTLTMGATGGIEAAGGNLLIDDNNYLTFRADLQDEFGNPYNTLAGYIGVFEIIGATGFVTGAGVSLRGSGDALVGARSHIAILQSTTVGAAVSGSSFQVGENIIDGVPSLYFEISNAQARFKSVPAYFDAGIRYDSAGLKITNASGSANSWLPYTNGNIYLTANASMGVGDFYFRVWDGTTFATHMFFDVSASKLTVTGSVAVSSNIAATGTLDVSEQTILRSTLNVAAGTTLNSTLLVRPSGGNDLYVTSGGRVGVGTSSPSAKFHVFAHDHGAVQSWSGAEHGDRVTLEISNNGGTTNTTFYAGRWGNNWYWERNSSSGRVRQAMLSTNGALHLYNAGTGEPMVRLSPFENSYIRLDLGIGRTTTSYRLDVLDNVADSYVAQFMNGGQYNSRHGIIIRGGAASNASHTAILFMDGSGRHIGSVVGNGSGGVNFHSASDRRLKNVLGAHTGDEAAAMLKAIEPIHWEGKYGDNPTPQIGFIAQEMEKVLPHAVAVTDGWYTMDYAQLTPTLWAALRQALERIETLEERIKELT